jgi:hypothetical protein
MAGGIDWFRWHHGSVTDPKFQLVARKAGASLPDVLAVWAYLLERASSAEFRGCFGEIDCEAVDCLFGFADGVTDAVMGQMVARQLIADQYIVAWEKRQPKREREDDSSAARTRSYRDRKAACDATHNHVTPCDATQRQETPRGEESREEQIQSPPPASLSAPPAKTPKASRRCPEDFAPSAELVAEVAAPGVNVARELAKFRDHTFKTARSDWPATFRNWLRDAADRAKPAGNSFMAAKAAENGKWLKGTSLDPDFIDMENGIGPQFAIR